MGNDMTTVRSPLLRLKRWLHLAWGGVPMQVLKDNALQFTPASKIDAWSLHEALSRRRWRRSGRGPRRAGGNDAKRL